MNIITGLQSNSDLHIGNYFGGILPMIKSLEKLEVNDNFFYFVPNLHSFTLPIDHKTLHKNTLNNVRVLLASGMDYNKDNIYLFRQSRISEHAELAWSLQCFTYYGEASRMTQFKDKSLKHDNFSVALFTYPILMASDILLYDCNYVPTGLDQQQHIELTRDIAIRFNNKFGDTFTPPKDWNEQLKFQNIVKGLKIMSLQDPHKKMSKSDNDSKGCIFMNDNPEVAYKKIMSATTDSLSSVKYDLINQPGISNLIQILSCIRNQDVNIISKEYEGMTQYGEFKKIVAIEVSQFLKNYQDKAKEFSDEKIEEILEQKEIKVKIIANKKLKLVYNKLGL